MNSVRYVNNPISRPGSDREKAVQAGKSLTVSTYEEDFSNLLASRPEMTKSSFAQVCKEALSEKGETTIQMRKEKLLL